MTYADQLQNEKWYQLREKVLHRDGLKCQSCQNQRLMDQCWIGLQTYPLEISNFKSLQYTTLTTTSAPQRLLFLDKKIIAILSSGLHIVYFKKIENLAFPAPMLIRSIYRDEDKEFEQFDEYWQAEFTKAMPNLEFKDIMKFGLEFNAPLTKEEYYATLPKTAVRKDFINSIKWKHVAFLNVHHTYYIKNSLAWEYPLESLETYCLDCHHDLHKSIEIPIKNKQYEIIGKVITCSRCYGSGYLPQYNYHFNGVCFLCGGPGFIEQ